MAFLHKKTATYRTAPTGVQLATWNATAVWTLNLPANTGAAVGTVFKVPRVDAFPANVNLPVAPSKTITVSGGAATLDGWDFRGFNLVLNASTAIVSNNLFDQLGGSFQIINIGSSGGPYTGIRVTRNTFDGGGIQTSPTVAASVQIGAGSTAQIDHNSFTGLADDGIDCAGDNCLIEDNYFDGGGWQIGAHADQIAILRGTGNIVRRNRISMHVYPGATGNNNAIRINSFGTNSIDATEIYNNITTTIESNVTNAFQCAGQGTGTLTNTSVHDNLWDAPPDNHWAYPTTISNVTGISQTNPGVITTATAHGAVVSDSISIAHVVGMTQANRQFQVAAKTPTTITTAVDTTGFGAYASGGTCYRGQEGVTVSSGNQKLSDGSSLTEIPIQ